MYDYLIVGAGLYGSVFAHEMTKKGFKCLVIDKRKHIGGNVYTENINGINVHKYGAHIFHTNDKGIWKYINQFAEFNNYKHKVFVNYADKIYSFPINLMTLTQLWGVTNPVIAQQKIDDITKQFNKKDNLEDWILSTVGEELYQIFIKGYTKKQWGRDPASLPSSIIKRLPVRYNFNDFYFDDLFQGIPIGGYTKIVEKMLNGIEVRLDVDYFKSRSDLDVLTKKIVFTGPIDGFFNYEYGHLQYRSLYFEEFELEYPDFQGTSVVNYTDISVPYTRILEHKHFEINNLNHTFITKEFPREWKIGDEAYYPINDDLNNKLYKKYLNKSTYYNDNVIFGGRLAEYRYYDMHQVIASALKKVKDVLSGI
jgi:UDP-galactopyranose mutase